MLYFLVPMVRAAMSKTEPELIAERDTFDKGTADYKFLDSIIREKQESHTQEGE